LRIFENSKNFNCNNCIIKEKRWVSMLSESPCMESEMLRDGMNIPRFI